MTPDWPGDTSAQAGEKPVDASGVTSWRDPASNGYSESIPKGVQMMASRDEIRALLAKPCRWCRAGVGERCSTAGQRSESAEGPRRSERRPIRTLDGGCHDARWQDALGRSAPVRAEAVAEVRGITEEPAERVLVGAAPVERPW